MKEIERKFKVSRIPDSADEATLNEKLLIYQGYLSIEPEVRVKSCSKVIKGRIHTIHTLTIKGDGSLSRDHVEFPISLAIFTQLVKMIDHPLIEKDTKVFKIDDLVFEYNKVDNDKLEYIEVEFESEEKAKEFDPSKFSFLGEEVTDNLSWKMKNYWENRQITEVNCSDQVAAC